MEPREKWYQTVSSARLDTSKIEIPLYTALNKAKKVKYFDSNGILQVCTMEEGFGKIAGIEKRYNGELFVFLYERRFIGGQNGALFHKAVTAAKPGISMDEFMKICDEVRIVVHEKKRDPLDKYIRYIETPSVERDADNFSEDTFDFVRVHVTLNDKTENIKDELEAHFPEIHQRVLNHIKECKDFKRHRHDVKDLVLSPTVKLFQNSIELIFELKK